MLATESPFPQYFDLAGAPLSGGYLYFGAVGQNPETVPITVYWDAAGTQPAAQPLRTQNGFIMRSGTPTRVYAAGDYSLTSRDSQKRLVATAQNSAEWGIAGRVETFIADLAAAVSPTQGAGMVGWGPGIAYPENTVGGKLARTLDVKDFGAVGDGVTDDAAAIRAALAYAVANTPCNLVFPHGHYVCDTSLGTLTNVSDLTIDLQGSTLDFGAVQTTVFDRLLYITGSYGASAALTSSAGFLTQTLAVVSTSFAEKDWVRIYSTNIWDSTRTSTKIGEINQIEAVPNAASATLVTPTQSSYTTGATATVQKLAMCRNVHIRNGTIIGPAADDKLGGVEIQLGLECSIQHVNFRDIDNRHARFVDCVQSNVSFCCFDEAREDSQAYAISFADATQDSQAVHNTMRGIRHAFTTNNNTTTSYGITRRCMVSTNQVYNNIPNLGGASGDALDTHAGSDFISFEHNTIFNAFGIGINVEARSAVVHGNKIYGSTAIGCRLASYADVRESEYQVTDNEFLTIGDGASSDYGIVVAPQVAGVERLQITGNKVSSVNTPLDIQGTASLKVSNAVICGNIFQVWTAGGGTISNLGGSASYLESGSVTGNLFSGPTRGFEVTNCTDLAISGNYAEITGTSGAVGYALRAVDSNYINFNGNSVRYTATGIASTTGVSANAGSTYVGIWSNITRAFTGAVATGGGTGSVAANNV